MSELDERVRSLLAAGDTEAATTLALRELQSEIFGFLAGVLGDDDANDVFSAWSERLWRSLRGFEGRCSLRTWTYVLARRELGRFRKRMRRHVDGRVSVSRLQDVLAVVRSATRSILATDKRKKLRKLRDELPIEDRTLLILRLDRGLAWDDIALAFAKDPEAFSDRAQKRESARLRKRFQLVKQRLLVQMRGAPTS